MILNQGDFALKGVIFSRSDTPSNLSAADCSINVVRMKWFPIEDLVSLDTNELNYTKKQRGKKSTQRRSEIPFNLLRRKYVSKLADLTGKILQSQQQ